LTDGDVVEQNDLGSIRRVTADTFGILSGMSIKRIVVNPLIVNRCNPADPVVEG
jgi:oxalate decarboxylase